MRVTLTALPAKEAARRPYTVALHVRVFLLLVTTLAGTEKFRPGASRSPRRRHLASSLGTKELLRLSP